MANAAELEAGPFQKAAPFLQLLVRLYDANNRAAVAAATAAQAAAPEQGKNAGAHLQNAARCTVELGRQLNREIPAHADHVAPLGSRKRSGSAAEMLLQLPRVTVSKL